MNDGAALLLAFHNHQPVGNFRSVFETAFADCYRPFLEAIREHPSIRFAAHYSGPLLEYMRDTVYEPTLVISGDPVGSLRHRLLGLHAVQADADDGLVDLALPRGPGPQRVGLIADAQLHLDHRV